MGLNRRCLRVGEPCKKGSVEVTRRTRMGLARKIWVALTGFAMVVLASASVNALTVINGAEFGFVSIIDSGANPVAGAVLDLGSPPAEFTVNINVADRADAPDPTGFEITQEFTNSTGQDRVFTATTLLETDEFVGADLLVSVDGGAFVALGLLDATFGVANGLNFVIKALATDVIGDAAANFDFTVAAVPLPPALFLFGGALFGLGFIGRRRRKAASSTA